MWTTKTKLKLDNSVIHWWRNNRRPVLVSSMQGLAGLRLTKFADTVHHNFSIPVGGCEFPPLDPYSDSFRRICLSEVFVVEECSCLGHEHFQLLLHRLQTTFRYSTVQDLLANKLILLVGDFSQLPPVCHHTISSDDICRRCHISNSVIWPSRIVHYLNKSIRHREDPLFADFLNIIRHRKPTQHEIDQALGPHMGYTETDILGLLGPDCTCLVTHRSQVQSYNTSMLSQCHSATSIVNTPLITNATRATPSLLESMNVWVNDPYFHTLQACAIGAPVIFTNTTYGASKSTGMVNGATGIVVDITYKPDQTVKCIHVELHCNGKIVRVHRNKYKTLRIEGNLYYKKTFPLMLAYAMTTHKAQGATIPAKVVIDMQDAFVPGLLYVALSRKPTRKELYIVGKLTPSMFTPVPLLL